MQIKDKQYYIYIRSTNQKIPVSYEDYETFYKETSVFRRRQQRRGLCFCPKEAWLCCDGSCDSCPYRSFTYARTCSFEEPFINKKGDSINLHEIVPDGSPLIEDIASDVVDMKRLLKRVEELMPEAIKIGELRLKGYSDEKISKELGIPRTTLLSRIKKLKTTLKESLEEFL